MVDPTPTDLNAADESGGGRRARELFIAAKRHDLRTPINAIIGYSEMLLEDAEGDDSSWTFDLEKIHSAGKSLLTTVNEMLGADKVDSGEADITDMASLGQEVRVAVRSDITSAIGYAEMILEDEDDLDEEVVADLERIKASASRMTDLVNDIVAFGAETDPNAAVDEEGSIQSTMVHGLVETLHDLDAERSVEPEMPGHILIVDDDETNRDLLSRRLEREGHTFDMAENGREALEQLGQSTYDLVLLDIMMPVMDGYATLRAIESDEALRKIPVIMLSALDQVDSVARCIEMGADDFLPKPFNSVLLRARIGSSLEKKRLRDREEEYLRQIEVEKARSDQLLLNILPLPIADRLKAGESTIADGFSEVTVLFSDLVGFTKMSAGISAELLVDRLNDVFKAFDALATDLGVEKIKTIGDAYMVVGGLPLPQPDHAKRIADMGLGMLKAIDEYNADAEVPLGIRVGINTGPVVAGVIGSTKFAYDLWGDAVNTASRMESTGLPGKIQVSESSRALLKDDFELEHRGLVEAKGKGKLNTYLLIGRL
jgi:adenylate cyclase